MVPLSTKLMSFNRGLSSGTRQTCWDGREDQRGRRTEQKPSPGKLGSVGTSLHSCLPLPPLTAPSSFLHSTPLLPPCPPFSFPSPLPIPPRPAGGPWPPGLASVDTEPTGCWAAAALRVSVLLSLAGPWGWRKHCSQCQSNEPSLPPPPSGTAPHTLQKIENGSEESSADTAAILTP